MTTIYTNITDRLIAITNEDIDAARDINNIIGMATNQCAPSYNAAVQQAARKVGEFVHSADICRPSNTNTCIVKLLHAEDKGSLIQAIAAALAAVSDHYAEVNGSLDDWSKWED